MRFLTFILTLLSLTSFGQEMCVAYYDTIPDVQMLPNTLDSGNYRIRCVVHILHNEIYEDSNLDDDITYAAIQELNSDLSSSNMSIQLQAIEHHDISENYIGSLILSGDVCFPTNIGIMSVFSSEYSWDKSQYLNIYCFPFACQYNYGFSFIYSSQSNLAEGLWINYRAFGTFGDHLDYARDLNKTMTHEFGHYAGLFHVFQDTDYCGEVIDDCESGQDRVCDTAPTKVNWSCSNPACPPAWNSTRPWADYQHNNHMDYYVDSCRTTFTEGQTSRMRNWMSLYHPGVYDVIYCEYDTNDDGVIGVDDLLCVLSCYDLNCCDISGDGITGTQDVLLILSEYGNICNVYNE